MNEFWKEHPALLYALSFLTGITAYLVWPLPWNILLPLLWAFYLLFLRRFPLLLLVPAGFLYTALFYSHLPTAPQPISAPFSISSFQPHSTPFAQGFLYKGTLHLYQASIPCSIFQASTPPRPDCDYLIEGELKVHSPYNYALKAKTWQPLPHTYSLAFLRYQSKERLRTFFSEHIPTPRIASFLSSLLTGEVQDRLLRCEFSRLGLQHLLAVSGFHFGILIAFASSFFTLFFPRTLTLLFLIATTTAYFLFVGPNPAVQRSWIAVLLYLIAKLFKKETSGLNLLGIALLFETIADPLTTLNLGFQLSFLSCAGILLCYSPLESRLTALLPKRTPLEVNALTLPSKIGALLSAFLRKAIALTTSVNLFLLPLLLYHFHTFPLAGLFYNLFFPHLVGIALFLLFSSCIAYFLFTPLSTPLFALTHFLTARLLDLTSFPPPALDTRLHATWIPVWGIPVYLFGMLMVFLIPFPRKCR